MINLVYMASYESESMAVSQEEYSQCEAYSFHKKLICTLR